MRWTRPRRAGSPPPAGYYRQNTPSLPNTPIVAPPTRSSWYPKTYPTRMVIIYIILLLNPTNVRSLTGGPSYSPRTQSCTRTPVRRYTWARGLRCSLLQGPSIAPPPQGSLRDRSHAGTYSSRLNQNGYGVVMVHTYIFIGPAPHATRALASLRGTIQKLLTGCYATEGLCWLWTHT